jgi:hypothetical protein
MRLSERQTAAIRRMAKDTAAIDPVLARQLELKGLVRHVRDYERREWNRVVAVLAVCELNDAGRVVLASLPPKARTGN